MNRSRRLPGFILPAVLTLFCLLLLAAWPVLAGPQDPPQGAALEKLLNKFEAYAEKNRQAFGIPGMAVAVVAGDQVIYSKGMGSTALSGGRPVDANTIFQIGSTSKAFTAALLALMVDRGKIKWRDKVITHYPDFVMKDPWVTREFEVADLLAQHTGLAPHCGDDLAFMGYKPGHLIRSLRYMEPATSFRSAYAYQNIPHLVAAGIVSRYTGKDFPATVAQEIFRPLGMKSSSVPSSGLATGENVTRLHWRVEGETRMLPPDWPLQNWIYTFASSGGINSSLKDMIRWLRLNINQGQVAGKRLISAQAMDFLHTPVTPVRVDLAGGDLFQYCQGWVYMRSAAPYTMIWHNGDTTVNHALIAFLPGRKVGLVMLSNLGGVDMLDALARYFFDLYTGVAPQDYCAQELKKLKAAEAQGDLPPRPQDPTPPQPLERYRGIYHNAIYGQATVTAEDGRLLLTVGPRPIKSRLIPWNRDQFGLSLFGLDQPTHLLGFQMDPTGRISQFKIFGLEHMAGGVFTRVK